MSTINTHTTSSHLPFIYKSPSKAFITGSWGKSSEKPAEKQKDFVGSNKEANQLAAKSLLNLHSEVQVLKVASGERTDLKNPVIWPTIWYLQKQSTSLAFCSSWFGSVDRTISQSVNTKLFQAVYCVELEIYLCLLHSCQVLQPPWWFSSSFLKSNQDSDGRSSTWLGAFQSQVVQNQRFWDIWSVRRPVFKAITRRIACKVFLYSRRVCASIKNPYTPITCNITRWM